MVIEQHPGVTESARSSQLTPGPAPLHPGMMSSSRRGQPTALPAPVEAAVLNLCYTRVGEPKVRLLEGRRSGGWGRTNI